MNFRVFTYIAIAYIFYAHSNVPPALAGTRSALCPRINIRALSRAFKPDAGSQLASFSNQRFDQEQSFSSYLREQQAVYNFSSKHKYLDNTKTARSVSFAQIVQKLMNPKSDMYSASDRQEINRISLLSYNELEKLAKPAFEEDGDFIDGFSIKKLLTWLVNTPGRFEHHLMTPLAAQLLIHNTGLAKNPRMRELIRKNHLRLLCMGEILRRWQNAPQILPSFTQTTGRNFEHTARIYSSI